MIAEFIRQKIRSFWFKMVAKSHAKECACKVQRTVATLTARFSWELVKVGLSILRVTVEDIIHSRLWRRCTPLQPLVDFKSIGGLWRSRRYSDNRKSYNFRMFLLCSKHKNWIKLFYTVFCFLWGQLERSSQPRCMDEFYGVVFRPFLEHSIHNRDMVSFFTV